jgi:uncharacterized protein (TIGR02145 family)
MYYNHNPLIGNMVHHKLKPMLIRFKIKLFALTCLSVLLSSCEPDDGELIELNCSTASTSGTIIQGSPATNIIVNVSYTSDGEGSYESQTIQSTGVLGLTATIPAGNFSDGSGTLSYTISGTPQSSGVASFAISVGGQSCTLTIQINSAVINNASASCGAPNVHNPNKTYGTMTDQEGNVYKTIVIGSQEWMAENLKTSIYSNGELIPNVTDQNEWNELNTGAWCYYNNDAAYECPYGKLYNWYVASDPRNVCPLGWHVPSDNEWRNLINQVDPDADGGNNPNNIGGGSLKSSGTSLWFSPNAEANNNTGFSCLPGGARYYFETFFRLGEWGIWWSSSETSTHSAWAIPILVNNSGGAFRNDLTKTYGYNIRCVRN